MSDERLPAPLEAIIRAIGGDARHDDQRAATFARGLAFGALVGAAIAGSTIWQRRQARAARRAVTPSGPVFAEPSEPRPESAPGSPDG